MKKILNSPETYVDDMLDALCTAHPQYYKQTGPSGRVIVRPDVPIKGYSGVGLSWIYILK